MKDEGEEPVEGRFCHKGVKPMESVLPFGEVLEAVDKLSLEEQETLIEIIRRRIIERRRAEIASNAATTLQAVQEGRARYGSVEDLKHDLSGEL
jgi:hypothetical protein